MLTLRYDEPLLRHTSLRIKGSAYCWAEPGNPDGILEAIDFAKGRGKRFVIIGNGTNLLFRGDFFDGVIIHLSKGFDRIKEEKGLIIKAGAGIKLAKLVKYASDRSLGGCEFLSGVPGDVGGAIFMNAGVRDINNPSEFIEIKDIISDVEILDLKDRKVKRLSKEGINFGYRFSGLDGKIILGAGFRLEKGKDKDIQARIKAFDKKRRWLGKIGFPNAGSVFKNPGRDKPAGMLIESCGLKGKKIGGAGISEAHANIIVNLGGAVSDDVLGLIDLARAGVKRKFGVELELELKVI